MQGSSGPTGSSSSTTSISHSQSSSVSQSSVGQSSIGQSTGVSTYTTTDTSTVALHSQSPYPSIAASSCGAWTLVDNVCCPSYCATDDTSESCTCSDCTTPPSADCKSGTMYPEVHSVSTNETWHYSVRPFDSMRVAPNMLTFVPIIEIHTFRVNQRRSLWFRPLWVVHKRECHGKLDRSIAWYNVRCFLYSVPSAVQGSCWNHPAWKFCGAKWRLLHTGNGRFGEFICYANDVLVLAFPAGGS
jgi:hypothetical protein